MSKKIPKRATKKADTAEKWDDKTFDIRKNSDWLEEEVESDYATPVFDSLKPQHQDFIIAFLRCNDARTAAIEVGYAPGGAKQRGWTLSRRPDVIEAIDELVNREMQHADAQRCQVIQRLQADSMVSLEDLVEWDDSIENFKIKAAEDVSPAFRRCIGMVSMSREGNPVFANTAQNTARKLLASYHGWDRSAVDAAPPIHFDFSGLKGNPKDTT